MTQKIKLPLILVSAFLLVLGPQATGFAQQANKEFSLGITNSSSSIVQLSTTSLKAMEDLGFIFPPSFDYLSRNFSTKFDFNKDGFNDIIWVVPKNPSIGSPLLVFLWNQEQKKFIEDPKFFVLGHGDHMFYYDTVDDFDGDGKPDLTVANTNAYTISVLKNNSAIGADFEFAEKIDLPSTPAAAWRCGAPHCPEGPVSTGANPAQSFRVVANGKCLLP